MQHIELDEQTARNLAADAAEHGMTVPQYLQSLLSIPRPNGPSASPDELDAELESLTLELPTLPADFSRADIYTEHD